MAVAFACFLISRAHATEFTEIKARELKALMDAGEKLLLINPLSDIEYITQHIPGSVNIPLQTILITKKLPRNKDQLIVTYCLGPNWILSRDAAGLVAKRGYTHIKVFKDGIPGWINAGYKINQSRPVDDGEIIVLEPAELHANLDDYLIVDIRPASAYKNQGYIPGSRAMPMAYLSMLSVELPKDDRIVLIDNGGHQLNYAAQWMINKGFQDVRILKGGMAAYLEAGFKLEK